MNNRVIKEVAEVLKNSKYAIASTGAGVSAESGIATFRDEGGIWDRIDVSSVATPEALLKSLERNATVLIPYFREILDSFLGAEPNAGHEALSELEAKGILKTLITQNGDNLHSEAGNKNIIELHGNFFRLQCLSCTCNEQRERRDLTRQIISAVDSMTEYDLAAILSLIPRCPQCNSLTRPDVVMFSEPVQNVDQAFSEANECDVMLVLGTSGSVYPASYLPVEAKRQGATVIVINPKENSYDNISDFYLPMKSGEALSAIVAAL